MKFTLKFILPVILILAVCAWAMMRMRPTVLVAEAAKGTAVEAVTGTVKVYANVDITVKTEVSGTINEMPYENGKPVKKGDILAVLDSEDLQNEIRQKSIQLEAAKKILAMPLTQEQDRLNLQDDIDRTEQQVQFGQSSKSDLERRRRELTKLELSIERQNLDRQKDEDLLQASLDDLNFEVSRRTIRAPMDCTPVKQYKWPGDYVWGGNDLLRIVSEGRWLELTLAEEDAAYVEKGQKAKIHLASYPDKTFEGTVTGLSAFSDPDKKTRAVFLHVDEPDEVLVPGLTGEAVLVKNEHPDAVLVPRRALLGRSVYVVKHGRVEIRSVEPGYTGLDEAEILSGVSAGETVILEGQSSLHDGELVETDTNEEDF